MIIDLPVLKSNKESQTQHGLKYENHQRYRSYCSRRLHRIRRSLNVAQGIPSTAKARHQRSRKLLNVTNAMVLEAGEKDQDYAERMLMIPLCLAERAWSYAMQLKQEISEYPRRRFHLVRRLKKASEYAQKFEALCNDPESPCTDRTKEEATAYAAYITGLYNVEKENWAAAKENLTKSLRLYFKLSVGLRNEEVLENYRQLIDELRASLRYCDFSLSITDEPKRAFKVSLPANLRFHDLAFKHVQELAQEEAEKQVAKVEEAKRVQALKRAKKEEEEKEKEKARNISAPTLTPPVTDSSKSVAPKVAPGAPSEEPDELSEDSDEYSEAPDEPSGGTDEQSAGVFHKVMKWAFK